MGCLKRYTKPVDGTIPIPALLYEDEDLLASQEGLGIYDGAQKSARHQSGTVHATTHRLFYIDGSHPGTRSFALDLSHVSRTEYYAGLFTSSPKVTLYLHLIAVPAGPEQPAGSDSFGNASWNANAFVTWECEVCSHRNPPGLSPAASSVCALCGVPRSSVKPSIPISSKAKTSTSSSHYLSTSLPSSSANLLALSSSISPSPVVDDGEVRGENGEIPCPACTFFNHPSLPTCEICGTTLPRTRNHATGHLPVKSAPSSRPTSPFIDDDDDDDDNDSDDGTDVVRMIRLSFRKGGDKAFYAVMRRSLLGKGWEVKSAKKRDTTASSSANLGPSGASQSGINGLLRTVETSAATAQNNMEDALQDLEALMVKAKDMVRLAEDLNERLTAVNSASSSTTLLSTAGSDGSTAVEPEEATFIRSSLSQLGLQMTNAPVTLDMISDERKWVEELAMELAKVLQSGKGISKGKAPLDVKIEKDGGMMGKRGIVGLDEIWGGWNRARGIALIPPSTFLQVLPLLPSYTSPPIHMRTLESSQLSVLHTPPYSKAAFAARTVGLLTLAGPKTTVEVAHEEQLPIGLVHDMIYEVEEAGEVCRDEGGGGIGAFSAAAAARGGNEIRWWVNVFRGYVWDGQAD